MTRTRALSFSLAALLILSAPFATATPPVGRPGGGGASIEWDVQIQGHERIRLSVLSPDGELFVREFNPGRNPSFRVLDLGGEVLDGAYNYELRVVPKVSNTTKQKLQDARAANDEAAIRKIRKEANLDEEIVQAGTFTILHGMILSPDGVEADANDGVSSVSSGATTNGAAASTNATASSRRNWQVVALDTVIPDDLIVQQSACVGFDCVDGESFGFDTLRLKENNLRIHFEDTSTSAGYPANDWRLVANDSTSGGANQFVLEDSTAARNPFVVEAAAPASSIYVDSSGNVGFQQSAPGLDLHLTTSDTPALRMEQTNSGGFTAQTWDIGANEANFFVRDLTGGSKLSFRIRPGAPTSSVDIAADGDVGIGTASPSYRMHVMLKAVGDALAIGNVATPSVMLLTNSTSTGTRSWGAFANYHANGDFALMRSATNTSSPFGGTSGMVVAANLNVGFGGVNTPTQPIQHNNGAYLSTGGQWIDASSRELKQNIRTLDATEAADALRELQPVTYQYKNDPSDAHVGFIAEDVPELVAEPTRKGLSPLDVVAVLTKVVQEQQKTIDELSKKVEQLEQQQ